MRSLAQVQKSKIMLSAICAALCWSSIAAAQNVGKDSGLPLPRFVSLKFEKVNMRVGPGKQFKVDWQYLKLGLPMEVIQEYDNWRKVRDPEGNEGWIAKALLSGKRTIIVRPWEENKSAGQVTLYASQDKTSSTKAKLEPGVLGSVKFCDEQWCQVSVGKLDGYVRKNTLWGVYPDENIE